MRVSYTTCFQIQRDTGLWYSVEYSSFSLGSEADKYRLSVSGFSGDEGDALAAPVQPARRANGMQFSCFGSDNDRHPTRHCLNGDAGWWLNYCTRSALNSDTRASWNSVTDEVIYDVKSSRMLVKLD